MKKEIKEALELIEAHIEDGCDTIAEACEIQEELERLAGDYDTRGTDIADGEAESELG